MNMEYLGIDFGTTNSLAGIVDDNKKLQLVPLEREEFEMPSAIFLQIKGYERLVFNPEEFERRILRAQKIEEERVEQEIKLIKIQLVDFYRAKVPRFKEPKPYDFINSYQYNKAYEAYLRDMSDLPRIIQTFKDTTLLGEEKKLLKAVRPAKSIKSIEHEIRIKMEQELLSDEAELLEAKTFFTAFSDPDCTPIFGQSAIDHYKQNPMSGFFMRSPKAFLAINLIPTHKELFVRAIALILSEIKRRSEEYLGKEFAGVVLGRPVNYMGSTTVDGNKQALDIMRQAAQRAGFSDIRFVIEPMAASLVIAKTIFDSNTPALVIDIGGGTTDVVLLKVDSSADVKLNVLNVAGERVGGNDFDETFAYQKIGPFVGKDASLKNGKNSTNELIIDALSTRDIYKQASFRKQGVEIQNLMMKATEPKLFERLYQVFQMQLQHQLLLISENCKKEITVNSVYEEKLSIFREPVSLSVKKEELPLIYARELNSIKRNILSVFEGQAIKDEKFRVFLTGGMSRCPTLIDTIKEIIPRGVVINRMSALQSVAAGLAVVSRQLTLSDDSFTENYNVRGIPVDR